MIKFGIFTRTFWYYIIKWITSLGVVTTNKHLPYMYMKTLDHIQTCDNHTIPVA